MSFPSVLRAVPLITVTDLLPFPQACEAWLRTGGVGAETLPRHTVCLQDPHLPRINASCHFSLWITMGKRLTLLACEMGVTLVLLHKLLVKSKLAVSWRGLNQSLAHRCPLR